MSELKILGAPDAAACEGDVCEIPGAVQPTVETAVAPSEARSAR